MLRASSLQRSSSSYFENNYGSNRNRSSSSSQYLYRHRSATNRNSNSNSNSVNSAEFIYQGRNKQQWATLQSKIRTRLATQNILYLEDELEMARRTTPPAPAVTLHAPAHYIESASASKSSTTTTSKNETPSSTSTKTNWPSTTQRLLRHITTSYQEQSSPIWTDGSRISPLEQLTLLSSIAQWSNAYSTAGAPLQRKTQKKADASSPASPWTPTEPTYSSPQPTPSWTTSPRP